VLGLALAGAIAGGGCRPARGPTGAALVVRAPAADDDADVWVDGDYVGQLGELRNPTTGPIRLAPGVHRVEVRKPGRFPVQQTVRVEKRPALEVVVEAELLEDPE
jgi:hypothetical protein